MRIVTLLIEDMRSGVPDSLLAEVRVPLKIDHDGGFWADAKDIVRGFALLESASSLIALLQQCEQLQGSPSRIDGEFLVLYNRLRY